MPGPYFGRSTLGLDIGTLSISFLERPGEAAYEFAWEMAAQANVDGYMGGDGNCWGAFTKEQVRGMLSDFSSDNGLSSRQEAAVWAWVESLPWDGDDIELHFSW